MKLHISLLLAAPILFLTGKLSAQLVYVESTDTQFNAGSHNSTYVSGTGSAATVGLDYYGRVAGTAAPGADEWFNGSWKYRQPVVIASTYPSQLSNYAVPVTVNTQALISAGRMNANGSDIRFTIAGSAGTVPALGYYIQSGLNTTATKIWVKSTAVNNGSNTLYMYYGNAAAPAASDMPAAFVLGNDFTAADGSVPSSTTWVNTESATPLGGSVRDIQTNRLRLRFGSALGLRHFGLRSASQYSFASPRRYHADINARSTGSDSWSNITLCPTIYSYSYDQDDWIRFSLKHLAAGPVYTVERSEYGVKSTLLSAVPLSAGLHGVDFLISSATFRVMLDGAQVYSGTNNLNFNSPYIYLEGASSVASLDDFLFDNVYVTPYAVPEPVFGSVGQDQGRRYPSGSFVSAARDTGTPGTRALSTDWGTVLSTGTTLSVEMRAHNTNVALATFTAVAKGADPAMVGRYLQYRLLMDTSDPRYSAALSSIALTYISPPSTPTFTGALALDSWTLKWFWQDNSSGQYQEDGFRLIDSTGIERGVVAAGVTTYIEVGLNPNTAYTRNILGYNAAGNGPAALTTKYTLPSPPNVSCDKSTGTWLSGTLSCSNIAGFGAGGVTYYRYIWTTSLVYPVWAGNETQWTSGTLPFTPGSSGEYYLHLKSYNADGATLAGDQTYGPYWYDKLLPQVSAFSPSSAPWTNSAGFPVQVTASDLGGSLLKLGRYLWTTTTDHPFSGWLPFQGAPIINTSSSAVSISAKGTGGQWYLHVEVDDQAGNTGYAFSGPYKLDIIPPGGSVVINGGAAVTPQRDITLALTYTDSESGVKQAQYRNEPPGTSFTTPELPQATSSWMLPAGDGLKTVRYLITDNAGNSASFTNTIQLDSRTGIAGTDVAARTSGVMGEAPETFQAGATLNWTPTGAPLQGKTITFVFKGSTNTALTDALGKAVTSFAVPNSSGPYSYSVSFSTDGVYAASSSTGMVTAAQRVSSVITEDVNALSNASFVAKATLRDTLTETNIVGALVTFVFEGSTLTATTDATGVATVNFTAPVPVGFYDYTAAYAGGPVYAARTGTGRIGVGRRVTSLTLVGVAALAQANFEAQATLLDGAIPVQNASINFFFQGSTQTMLTNASGVASYTFTAPASSGTYPYSAAFDGDTTYAASSGGAILTVNRRPLSLAGQTGMGYVNSSFQARAVLSDGGTGDKVAGKTIIFQFEASSAAVVTDALGVSTAVFNTGSLPRATSCYYYFAGDSGYSFADSTGAVSVERRPVALAASAVSALLNSTFTATAQLKDTAFTPVGIPGKTISFVFGGQTQTVVTDALGVASATYQAGLSTGTYEFYATFAQDGVYLAGSDTGTVTMDKRPSVVSAYPRYVFAFDTIQVVADLKDGVTGEYIGSQPINFNYNDITQSTTTVASGVTLGRAYAVYAGTGVAGAYSYYADFPGNSLYAANSSTASITVSQRSVNLSAFPQTAIFGSTFTATAEFRDGSNNSLVSGKTLRLVFQSSTVYGPTIAGAASTTFNAPASTGTFNWVADFAGDQTYAQASSTGTITVLRRTPTVTPITTTKYVWDSISLSATLMDAGTPVASRLLSFSFNGSTNTATTDVNGVATTVAFSSVSVPGPYNFTVSFGGDANYSAQSASATVTVVARPSSINLGPVSTIANSTITLSATLNDTNWSTPIAGKAVTFTLQGATFTVTANTNGSGIATANFVASGIIGPYNYSASFSGNTNYSGTSNSNVVTVALRPSVLEMADYSPPASSTFTVSAVLKDYTSGAYISSKVITFYFLSSSRTATTDGLGSGATAYVTLASTMSYPISVSFPGSALYAPASTTKTVYPGKRNTSLLTSDMLTSVALDSFTVTARLKDYDLGTFLAGQSITFSFTGSTYTLTSVTDSTGMASVDFTAPASTGPYTYTATFAGTALYSNTLNTSAVLVNRRTLIIDPGGLTGVPAASTFTVSALLRDGAVTISTKTLSFVFYSTKTAVTNGIGIASTTFPAPISTGTYSYAVSYMGDALYNPVLVYGNVGVVLKATVLQVLDVPDAVVGLPFTGTAKLTDVELGAVVPSTKAISFTFSTYTLNSVTGLGVGIATVSMTAPLTVGDYSYTAAFAGDSTYGSSQSSGTITVKKRPVIFSVDVPAGEPYTLSTFTVKGTLVDGKTGAALAGQTLKIYFSVANATHTVVTDATGIATTDFYSGISSGSYRYSGTFDGDSSYNASEVNEQTSKVVKINPRPTSIQPWLGDGQLMTWGVYTFNDFNTIATMQDNLNSNSGIPGLTVRFVVQGSTRTGVSAANGQATSSSPFPYISNAGSYPAEVVFDGNQTYAPSVLHGGIAGQIPLQGFVQVYQSPANIAMDSIQESFPSQDTVISGVAHDGYLGDRPAARPLLKGLQIKYRVSGVACSPYPSNCPGGLWSAISYGNVDDSYIATATVHAPAEIGDYPIDRTFDATSSFYYWYVTEDTRVLRVGLRPTAIGIVGADPLEVGAQMPITIKVKLKSTSQGDIGVANKTVVITFNGGSPQNVTTDSMGIAQYTFAGLPVGAYTYTATFAGDTAYNSTALSPVGNVSVVKNITFLVGTPVINVPAGNDFTAKATLNVLVGTAQEPAAGRTITFNFTGNASSNAVTNAQGIAQVTFTSPQVPGEYIFTADLPTNANDLASSAIDPTRRVQVIQRHTSLASVAVNPVYIQDSFVSTATLTDLDAPPNLASLIGQTINFTLHRGGAEGDIGGIGTTAASPLGQATKGFLSPAAFGSQSYTASFPGDTLYAAATSDAGVNVLKRTTVLSASVEPTAPTNTIFTATVTLKDNTPTLVAPVAMGVGVHVPVKFTYNGVTNYGTTDDFGVATATFTAQAIAANYNCAVAYEGNTIYAASSMSLPVHVIKRVTHVTGVAILSQAAGAPFTAQATLTDDISGIGIQTALLNFIFTGGGTFSGSGTTDISGTTSTVFTAPLNTGVYNYTACFPGDATYDSSCDNNNSVTVDVSSTTLATPDGTVTVNNVFFATATLKGKDSGLGLIAKTVNFTYDGVLKGQPLTNVNGIAVQTFTPTSTGTYRLDVAFLGDPAFYSSASSATITVIQRNSGAVMPKVYTEVNALFITTVTLVDISSVPSSYIAGRTVDFLFEGTTKSAVTNAVGVATVSYTAPAVAAGTYPVTASFAGDAIYTSTNVVSSVIVAKLITLITVDPGSVQALDVFNATATLKSGGVPVVGKPITFLYKGVSLPGLAVTDSNGQAFVQYNAGASSGPWRIDAAFENGADPVYDVSSGSNTITVLRRSCVVIPDNASVAVFDVFNATATFVDVVNPANNPSGKMVTIVFISTLPAALTDGSGKAYKTGLTAPSSSGTYKMEAFYLGDATYAPSIASTSTITVARRPSQLSMVDVNTIYGSIFTATATLKSSTVTLSGKPVRFTYEGRPFTSLTNSSGIAVATYTVTLATGATRIDAEYDGDATYIASIPSSATVTVAMRPTTVFPSAASVIADKIFVASATLRDVAGSTVPAQTLSFLFNSININAVTDSLGIATAAYTANVATGTYPIAVSYAGDFRYLASSATLTLTILRRPTSMVPLGAVSVKALDIFSATATLKDVDQITLGSQNVYFVFAGSTFTRVTDGSGVAFSTWAAPASSGTYYVGAYFDGDSKYAPSTSSILVTNLQRPVGITLNPVSSKALDLFTTTATLTDLNNGGIKVSTKTVNFSFSWGASTNAITNAVGVATASYNATATAGTYQLTGTFAGDATFASTTTVTPLIVSKRDAFVTGNYVSARVMDVFIATGTFYDAVTTTTVSGRTMKFYLQSGSTLTAVTDGAGLATAAYTAPAASGTYTLSTFFEGDATYNPSAVYISSVTLTRRASSLTVSAPASVIINSSVAVSALMRDMVSLATVSGRTVSFLFQGTTIPATTDSFGVAYATFSASVSSGVYNVQASFSGDFSYDVAVGSKNVTMLRYPTFITASSVTVPANQLFSSSATLTDFNGSTVPAKALVFYFNSSSFSAVTSSLGIAYSTYTASASTGVYQMPVSFAGDALYASTGIFIPVSVTMRPSAIIADPVTVRALNVFTATATLTDALTPAVKLTGETVTFDFFVDSNTYTRSVTVGAGGVAVATFTAPSASGSYLYKASFAGNAVNLATATLTGALVTVTARPAALLLNNAASPIDELFRTTATLTDLETGNPVNTRTVTFTFGASSAALTDTLGQSWVNFMAPASSGTFRLDAAFAGDPTYTLVAASSTLTVTRRPVIMTAPDIPGILEEVFIATATITDGLNAGNISSRTISFSLPGSTVNAVSNGIGIATTTFTAPSSSGTYYMPVNFAGDARYLPNSTTTQLTVALRPSAVVPDIILARAGEVFTATATLKDVLKPSYKASGRILSFYFSGSTFAAATDANGVAVSTFAAPVSSGTFAINISFAGDSRYIASSSATAVTVLRRLSNIALDNPVIVAMSTLTVSGTLTDKVNPAVFAPFRDLSFFFAGSTFAAVTDASGVAVSTFAGPLSSGTYVISASFAGDSIFDASTATSTLTVLQRPSRVLISTSSAYPFEQFVAAAGLVDDASSSTVSGRQLVFDFNLLQKSGTTDIVGVATAAFTPPAGFGDYELAATFAGDSVYALSTSTGMVTVLKRPTIVFTIDTSTAALDTFVVSAALADVRFSTSIPGQDIVFTFEGQTSTVTVGPDGIAGPAVFTAPVSSGTYYYQALFPGTSVYALSSSTGAVTVLTRETRVIARDTTANVGEPFVLTAELVDPAKETMPGYYVSSATVEFKFKDRNNLVIETKYANTNDIGVASAAFSGPGAPDVYYYTAKFVGNYTYSPSSATAVVKVGLLTSLVAFNVDTYALKPFNVNAKLTDYLSTTLDGKLVRFKFLGASNTGVTYATGLSGVATSSFTAPASSGTYFYMAYFDGDSFYSASNATATVTVERRPSSILPATANITAFSSFTVTAVLKDVLTPEMNIGGRDVYIAFNGSTATINTAAETGEAATSFFANVSSGTYPYYAWFDGDDTFAGTFSTGTVNVALKASNMLSYNVIDVTATSTFTARVQLKDNANQPLKDLSVDFLFGGNFGMGVTNAQGIAQTIFTAPASSGTYAFTANFYGDSQYSASSASGDITVGPRPTMIFAPVVSSKLGTPLELSARLIDVARQSGIEGKTLSFVFEGVTVTAVTDSQGISTAAFSAPLSTGTFAYEATYTGDAITFFGSYSSAPVTIALNLTNIEALSPISIKIYEPLAVNAKLTDSIGLNLAGQPVVFTFQGTDQGAVTDPGAPTTGIATTTFVTLGLLSTGTYSYAAQYPGDSLYVASSDTSNVVDVQRRDTLLIADAVQSVPGKAFTAQARLTDNVNGSALLGSSLTGKQIVFEFFDGAVTSSAAVFTSATGISTASFMAPASTGTYQVIASFADDDPVYKGFISTGTVKVQMDDGTGVIRTKIVADHVNTYINTVFTASATLTASGEYVPGKTLLFSFFTGASTFTAAGATDSLGVATAAFTAPVSSGVYTFTASYAGDATYSAAVGTNTVTSELYPDTLTAEDILAEIGTPFTARAVLRDDLAQIFVAGKQIVFEFANGVSTFTHVVTAVTSSTGSAQAVFQTPAVPGTYSYLARFAGDALYREAFDTGTVLIAARGSNTSLVGQNVLVSTGEYFTALSTLSANGFPVTGKAVSITFQGVTLISTTNANGEAFGRFTAPAASGTFVCSSSFAGDILYNTVLSTLAVNVVFKAPPVKEEPVGKADIVTTATTTILTLAWPAIAESTSAFKVTGFIIEEFKSLRGSILTSSGSVAASSTSAMGYTTEVDNNEARYFRKKNKLSDNQELLTNVVVEIPSRRDDPARVPNYYYMSDDNSVYIKIPGKLMNSFANAQENLVGISTKAEPGFIKAYKIESPQLRAAMTSAENSGSKGIRLGISYLDSAPGTSAATSGQMALYWYNGVEWIKLGGQIDVLTGEIYTYARTFGLFAIKAAPLSSTFAFTSVKPRIFSPDVPDSDPNGTIVNRAVFSYENPGCSEVTVRIFDITGALVRRNLDFIDCNRMYWNGKDQAGVVVRGGIYIYQIEAGENVVTGTVVVAK